MNRRRRGLMIIAALLIVLVLGALATALVVLHAATYRAETIGRARSQAALAARGALEVVRHQGLTPQAQAGEILFANGVVTFSCEDSRGECHVLLDARFRTRGDLPVRRRFRAALEKTPEGAKLVSWEEVFGPAEPSS